MANQLPSFLHSFFEKLEDRVLFDGVPDAAMVLPETTNVEPVQVQKLSYDQSQLGQQAELIIIDSRIENGQELLDSLIASKPEASFEIRILDSTQDGVRQISEWLSATDHEFEAIHILSHGAAGNVELGGSTLSLGNVDRYQEDLSTWASSLTDNADILFYGCDLAGNQSGQQLLEIVSQSTGADVAASTDLTGDSAQNADWELELSIGQVETQALSASNWSGTLAVEATDGILTIQDAENSAAGTITLTNNGAPELVTVLNTPTRVGQMLERVWQFNETADTGRATFVFDVSGIPGINATIASEFGLIVSDQFDLADGPNTTTLVASGYDAANGKVFFHQVDLASGDYFGLATEVVQDNFSIFPTATGLEDTAIDLGLTLSPSLTQGGQLQDIIATDVGFRASTAGTTTADFFVPAGTTGIRITGFSTRDIGTGANEAFNDDYQFLNVSIDLGTETSNGYIGHIIDQGPNRSDQFGFSDAPLGTSVLTGGGTVIGDANDNIDPTFTIVDGVLMIEENHQLQTGYHVEFLTNATSSAEFIGTESAVLKSNDQSLATLSVPANADFLVVNINDAAAGSSAQIEYKGNSRVYIDLATLQASGVVAAEQGETDARVVNYGFEDYDVSSAGVGSILSAAGSIAGDTTGLASVLNDNQIYIDGAGNLVIDRNTTFANNFNSLITVEYYERRDVGSSADQLGESTDFGFFNSDPSNPTSTLEFDIPENATLGILNLTQNGTNNSNTNENSGAGFAVIDLVNGTSSGSIYFVRASSVVDLVGFDSVPFGTAFFDDPGSISNHTNLNQFNDPFGGTAAFNLINGGTTLEFSANSDSGGRQSFLDYFVGGQVEWFGAAPFEISGSVAGGTFSQGTLNPTTGNVELTFDQAASGLSYIPPAHVSGTTPLDVTLRIGDESETTSVTIQAVIDPITFGMTADACGHEDTDIPISANITPVFIDQDGSETLTMQILSNIPIGHTLTDGTNVFVSSAGSQSVDVTAWDTAAITYRANPNQSGTFTITNSADFQDVGGGVTDTSSVTETFDVVVKPANDPPVAVDDFYTVLGNTILSIGPANGVLNNDSDVENDPLTVNTTPISGPSDGTLTLNPDGSFTYTPTSGFSGSDSFDYEISDGNGGTAIATAFIDVSVPVTGPLNAVDDMVTTNEETLINIAVMANDALPTTGAFNIQSTTPPSNGSVTVLPDGTIDYAPNPNFFGTDTFTYTLADASGRTSTATVTVTVNNVQDPPVANADSGSTPEDTTLANINILANDSDLDNDTLTVTTAVSSNGTVVINANGTIDYTPNPDFFGTDTVNYTISDGNGGFASSIVLINVVPVADPPTSADNTVTLVEDTSYTFVSGDFAFADQDPGDSLVAVRIETLPTDGQLLINGIAAVPGQVISLTDVNNRNLIFVPDPDDFGNNYTTFDFSVTDGVLFQTTPNTATINVTPVQDPPIATDNAIVVNEDSTANPLGVPTPTDVDGDTLTATVTGLPAQGIVFLVDGVTVVNNGDILTIAQLTSLVYDAPTIFTVPNAGSFTYDLTDGIATDSGQVDITITPINDAPFVDLNGGAPGEDFADTFTEGGPPVNAFANPGSSVFDEDDIGLPFLKIEVDQSTVVDPGQEFLTIGGVDFQLDAAANSSDTIFFGGLSIDVTYTAATGRFDFVRSDGMELTPGQARLILLDTTYRNDSALPTVGDRDFHVCTNDGDVDSNLATSTISVVRDVEQADWSITGSATVIDGNSATYVVALSAPLRAGETASADLGLTNIDTNAADLGSLDAAVTVAVAGYSGPGALTWNGTTLTFTSDGTGAMEPLSIALLTTPDGVFEGNENYRINLSNPASTTGEVIAIDAAADEVTTAIIDNTPAPTVTISDASATEGSPVVFRISLDVPSFEPITLNLAAAGGTATAGADFETTNFEFFDGAVWQPAVAGTQVTIPAGQTSLMVRIDSVQEGLVESNETFELSASAVSGGVTSTADTGIGTIINDDVSLISIDDVTVDEDNGVLTFTISLDQAPSGNVSVDYATTSGSATSGVDFTATSGTATFAPGEQTQTVSVAITQDNIFEGPHTFDLNLTNASGGTIADPSGVGTIIDDGTGPNGSDDDRPVISINNVTDTETIDTHAVFTISLSNPSIQDTDLSLALISGTATSGSDFGPGLEFFDGTTWQPVTGNVTIAALSTSIQVRTPIIDDAIADNNEAYSLVATRVSGTTFNTSATGLGTILDDNDPTLVSISGPASVTEGNSAVYTVSLDSTPVSPVTLTFTYIGTASEGTDYSGVATITIAAGSTTGTVTIPTINDTLGEPLENFTIAIDSATGGSFEDLQIDPTAFNVTTDIIDDDVPEIAINDVIVTEGVEGFAEFTVQLSNPTFEIIDFNISASGVSATGEGVDFGILGLNELEVFNGTTYVPATSASFAIGATTIRLRTPIVDDVLAEPVETFNVTVTTTGGTTSNASDTGLGTIQEDTTDLEVVLVSLVGPSSVVEGATTTDYTLALTDPSGSPINAAQDITVTLLYTGTATDGSDYTSVATVLIPLGSGAETFTLPTINDSFYEGTEDIIITIDSVTGGGFEDIAADPAADTVTTLITDAADIPTVAVNNVTSIEGTDNFAVYTVSLSNPSFEDIDVSLGLASGTALGGGVDFGAAAAGNLQVFNGTGWVDATTATIPAGQSFVQVRTPLVDDPIDEPTENYTLTVDVTAGTTTNIQVIGTGTIIDDDAAPDVTIVDATTTEGDPLVFNVSLTNPSSQPIVLDFAASDATATAATDYNATAFEFSTDGGVTFMPATGGTQVTIPVGSTAIQVRVQTTQDLTLETTETVQLSIASVVSGLAGNTTDTAVGTILDDDSALVSIVANDSVAGESANNGQFTVTMTNPSDSPTVIAYSVTGSATNGGDFASVSGTITLPAGVTSDTIDINVIDDLLIEGNENVTITLTSITSGDAQVSIDTANDTDTVTITDDDTAQWSISGSTSVGEGAIAKYTIGLAGTLQAGETATVQLTLGNITAIAADRENFVTAVNAAVANYTGPGTLSFDGTFLTFTSDGNPMGDLCIELTTIDDAVVEGNEDFFVSIANPSSTTGSAIGTSGPLSVTTTITDNDVAIWSIVGDGVIAEGGSAKYTVLLAGTLQAGETATIELAIGDVSTNSDDYASFVAAVNTAVTNYVGPGLLAFDGTTLTFTSDGNPMGDLCIELAAIDDAFAEGNESFTVGISNPGSTTGIVVGTAANLVSTTIQDNDSVQWSIVGDVSVDEGGIAGYTISLSGILQTGENSIVELSLVDLETNSGDYDVFATAVQTAIAGRSDLAFDAAAGTLTATGTGAPTADLFINLDAINDTVIEGPERYQVQLSNATTTTGSPSTIDPANNTVTTTINDTVGNGGGIQTAIWSIGGDQIVPEGNSATYQLNLDGVLQAGEVVSIDLKLSDVDTIATDYESFDNAVIEAVANYAGPGSLTWNGTTLTFTSDGTGAMAPLSISLGTVNDGFAEGAEDFLISLCNANSSTGVATDIDAMADDVVTTIDDTIGPEADQVTFSIVGDNNVDEGGTATYTVSITNGLAAGDDATVELSIGDVDTDSADYAGFDAAVVAAVANYNSGSNPGSVSWDGTTLTFTAATDGDTLTGLVIDLGAIDDALLEGPEVYDVTLANAGSNTGIEVALDPLLNNVFTTINDTVGDGGAAEPGGEWSITGTPAVTEGDPITFTISLTGNLQAGESTVVQLNVVDVETTGADYSDVNASINAAAAAYNSNPANSGTISWDGTFLTFVSDGTGPMSDLTVTFSSIDDLMIEGDESVSLVLSNPTSPTGLSPTLSPADSAVTTTIADNDAAQWAIVGPAITVEGTSADYMISLDGIFQAGQVVSVELGIADIDTTSGDYGSLIAAATAAAAANPDVTFDSVTGTFTYTAPADGATMADLVIALPIISDGIAEAPEDFQILLTNPSSSSGLAPTVDPTSDNVVTTISGDPLTNPDNLFTNINTPVVGNVLTNDFNLNGGPLMVTQIDGQPIGAPIVTDCGTVVINPNGSFVFTPNPGFSGVDTFEYTVVDQFGNSQTETVTITINEAAIGSAKAVSDPVPNEDNFDLTFTIVVENLGNVDLDNLTVVDDVAAQFGSALVATGTPVIANFSGSGTPPTINSSWVGDTSQNIINGGVLQVGSSFEIVVTVTVDPDAGGMARGLSNQATVSGQGINPDGSLMTDTRGNQIVVQDDSDNGSNPTGENGNEASVDGIEGNDVTEILIADLGIAKTIVGEPVLTEIGNFVVTYRVVVENTGTVDLGNLSLLEDLTTQFGSAFVNAGNLTLATAPTDPLSNISVDSAGWNGFTQIELIDNAASSLLASGDSFAIEFEVEIDPRQVATSLGNQIEGSAGGVDANGDPLLDISGNPIIATDLSDSGSDPGSTNANDPSDNGTSDDVSEFVPPEVPLSEISGVVFVDDNGNGVQDPGEAGIEGVEITLVGVDVFGNPVDVVVLTDASGLFVFDGLNAGVYSITQTQPEGFEDGVDNGDPDFTITNDMISNIYLGFDEVISTNSFGERGSGGGASGNPPSLPGLPPILNSQLSNLLNSFVGSPGPIYSGVPISDNANPLSFDSGSVVMGGYLVELDACGCPEVNDLYGEPVDSYLVVDPCIEIVESSDKTAEPTQCEICESPYDEVTNQCGCEPAAATVEELPCHEVDQSDVCEDENSKRR